jgi:hypothetical protein
MTLIHLGRSERFESLGEQWPRFQPQAPVPSMQTFPSTARPITADLPYKSPTSKRLAKVGELQVDMAFAEYAPVSPHFPAHQAATIKLTHYRQAAVVNQFEK